jgi:hemoglobin
MSRASIYEFAGGEEAFLRLAQAHHERCLRDPVLNHPFGRPGLHPEHARRLALYLGEVFGGPPAFSETCGDQSSVLTLHAGNGMGEDIGERFVSCFVAAADDAGLPADPEFRGALRSYMEWAVSEMLSHQRHDSRVAAGLPMPRWTWEGLATPAGPMPS